MGHSYELMFGLHDDKLNSPFSNGLRLVGNIKIMHVQVYKYIYFID